MSGYCKQCCNEHWDACVSFNSGFLGVYAQQWDCWVVWQFYFQLFKESPHCSPVFLPGESHGRGSLVAAVYGVTQSRTRLKWLSSSTLFSIVVVLVCIPTNSVRSFLFSTPSAAFIVCRHFDSSHSDQREMVPRCGFDLHFSDNEWCWASFHVFVSHLYVFFGEMSV